MHYIESLSFEDRLSLLLHREISLREDRRLTDFLVQRQRYAQQTSSAGAETHGRP